MGPDEGNTPVIPKAEVRLGLIALGVIALASALCTLALISFIAYRSWKWNSFYATSIRRNVFVILLCNLFLADFFQSIGFLFSWYWLRKDGLDSYTGPCTVQGLFINFGDVSSAFFVLAIAGQTWLHLRFKRQLRFDAFLTIVVGIWIFALILTVLGPATTSRYFADTGAWCWVDPRFKSQRLAYHYFWIFLVEFGTVVVYGFVIWELRRSSSKLSGLQNEASFSLETETHRRIQKSCLIMCCYPIAYITLTLPLAVSRMSEIRGADTSIQFLIFCGCFLVSSGWVDTVLYILTRASFLKVQGHTRVQEESNQRSHRTNSAVMFKNISRTYQGSPAQTRTASSPSPTDEPGRVMSLSSWKYDTKTLPYSRTEETFSTLDNERLIQATSTLNP
ncbi:uncharacterized protein PV09_01677 [Verruconis gallopava]|uniref:G protein-coupled receptor GPR1/2/3 C-terminal domain-containing protein n=1 Tax=Verruconis gallopava TaxID=253628 RepID=A0A0D1Z441_9PEZI|nr:uncharacterized protein PV09_01677 [Verruconis gallopava]KIW07747.1 hypothetical protein PV09_01677 [Verruconis gallopava]